MLSKVSLLQIDKRPSPPAGQTVLTQWRCYFPPLKCRCLTPVWLEHAPELERLLRLEQPAQEFSVPSWLATLPSYGVTLLCKPWQTRRLNWATLLRISLAAQSDLPTLDFSPQTRISSGHAALPLALLLYPFRRQS